MARSAYFRIFTLTEVQQTFYHPPQTQTLERWRDEAPANFEFTLKAWQLITHPATSPTYRRLRRAIAPSQRGFYGAFQPTAQVLEAWQTTLSAARALAARIIVFQSPSSFIPSQQNIANLRAFFTTIQPERADMMCGWESRGSWPADLVARLVGELNLIWITDPFVTVGQTDQPIRYFRLHGRPGTNYRYSYSDAELQQLLRWCRAVPARQTYVLFNNTAMVADAQRFLRLI
ncbi:MAG TPA: DUF72 domain-containing protein [Tepidisphaeraceae bacterium]|nr:DUF72 domain-containing protein [Tepidisphaeraceae bacterium]